MTWAVGRYCAECAHPTSDHHENCSQKPWLSMPRRPDPRHDTGPTLADLATPQSTGAWHLVPSKSPDAAPFARGDRVRPRSGRFSACTVVAVGTCEWPQCPYGPACVQVLPDGSHLSLNYDAAALEPLGGSDGPK